MRKRSPGKYIKYWRVEATFESSGGKISHLQLVNHGSEYVQKGTFAANRDF